ncbi:FAD binding domain-containing protein [Lineolata rhizophorae]|uniref:FAD binding domain-containing protein n=1 Tax=Lineolata rhizophorae TaxID=578093 RepID=A0A6A6PBQ8_9PEZI|nr:FAD binding domain-containing protein [Lineolata rhizophorae]
MERYDIVIVGAGPVGLLLSTCLARWGYKIKHVDNRPEPTPTGRADGIQPRSLELLRNMGLKRAIMAHDPARVYEVAFWDPAGSSGATAAAADDGADSSGKGNGDRGAGIVRTGTWASCPSFIDARYPFTTLLHQGLIERVFIADMEKNGVRIQRPWTITGFANDGRDAGYPVEVSLASVDGKQDETVRAKYLFSGEGARSFIREQLGVKIYHKDPIAHVWGVMDGVVRTDFPDIKMKCTIHSDSGSIMVIPRESNMVRLYIQIASSTDKDWNPRKTATPEEVQATAKRILKPYFIEWDHVEWYSVYPIGQGIAERYTLDERVFMGGDCCHTHSPKAGQGMNYAFLDAQNLAWKIHQVEAGFADRNVLLPTYESERRLAAENLLNFDAKYASLFSQRLPSAGEAGDPTENEFIRLFKESCELTSGYGVAYPGNVLNWGGAPSAPALSPSSRYAHLFLHQSSPPTSSSSETETKGPRASSLSPGYTLLRPGRILPSATATRITDANPVHLEQAIPLNGAWRVYIFCGSLSLSSTPTTTISSFTPPSRTASALSSLAAALARPSSILSRFAHPRGEAPPPHSAAALHTPLSRFLSFVAVVAAPRAAVAAAVAGKHGPGDAPPLPDLLARNPHHVYADDVGEGVAGGSSAASLGAAHRRMGLRPEMEGEGEEEGPGAAIVVVRPDGYVGCVVRLVEGEETAGALEEYFGGFVVGGLGGSGGRREEEKGDKARL